MAQVGLVEEEITIKAAIEEGNLPLVLKRLSHATNDQIQQKIHGLPIPAANSIIEFVLQQTLENLTKKAKDDLSAEKVKTVLQQFMLEATRETWLKKWSDDFVIGLLNLLCRQEPLSIKFIVDEQVLAFIELILFKGSMVAIAHASDFIFSTINEDKQRLKKESDHKDEAAGLGSESKTDKKTRCRTMTAYMKNLYAFVFVGLVIINRKEYQQMQLTCFVRMTELETEDLASCTSIADLNPDAEELAHLDDCLIPLLRKAAGMNIFAAKKLAEIYLLAFAFAPESGKHAMGAIESIQKALTLALNQPLDSKIIREIIRQFDQVSAAASAKVRDQINRLLPLIKALKILEQGLGTDENDKIQESYESGMRDKVISNRDEDAAFIRKVLRENAVVKALTEIIELSRDDENDFVRHTAFCSLLRLSIAGNEKASETIRALPEFYKFIFNENIVEHLHLFLLHVSFDDAQAIRMILLTRSKLLALDIPIEQLTAKLFVFFKKEPNSSEEQLREMINQEVKLAVRTRVVGPSVVDKLGVAAPSDQLHLQTSAVKESKRGAAPLALEAPKTQPLRNEAKRTAKPLSIKEVIEQNDFQLLLMRLPNATATEIRENICPLFLDRFKKMPAEDQEDQYIEFSLHAAFEKFLSEEKDEKANIEKVKAILERFINFYDPLASEASTYITQEAWKKRLKWRDDFAIGLLNFLFSPACIDFISNEQLLALLKLIIIKASVRVIAYVSDTIFTKINAQVEDQSRKITLIAKKKFDAVTCVGFIMANPELQQVDKREAEIICFAKLMDLETQIPLKGSYSAISDLKPTPVAINQLLIHLTPELEMVAKFNVFAAIKLSEIYLLAFIYEPKDKRHLARAVEYIRIALTLDLTSNPPRAELSEQLYKIHDELAKNAGSLDPLPEAKEFLEKMTNLLSVAKPFKILKDGVGPDENKAIKAIYLSRWEKGAAKRTVKPKQISDDEVKVLKKELRGNAVVEELIKVIDLSLKDKTDFTRYPAFCNLLRLGCDGNQKAIEAILNMLLHLGDYLKHDENIRAHLPAFLTLLSTEQQSLIINRYIDQCEVKGGELHERDVWLLPFFENPMVREALPAEKALLLLSLYLKIVLQNENWKRLFFSLQKEDKTPETLLDYRRSVMLELTKKTDLLDMHALRVVFRKILSADKSLEFLDKVFAADGKLLLEFIANGIDPGLELNPELVIPYVIKTINENLAIKIIPIPKLLFFWRYIFEMIQQGRFSFEDLFQKLSGGINGELLRELKKDSQNRDIQFFVNFLIAGLKQNKIQGMRQLIEEDPRLESQLDCLLTCYQQADFITVDPRKVESINVSNVQALNQSCYKKIILYFAFRLRHHQHHGMSYDLRREIQTLYLENPAFFYLYFFNLFTEDKDDIRNQVQCQELIVELTEIYLVAKKLGIKNEKKHESKSATSATKESAAELKHHVSPLGKQPFPPKQTAAPTPQENCCYKAIRLVQRCAARLYYG